LILITQNDLFKDSGANVPKDQVPLSAGEKKALADCVKSPKTSCKTLTPAQVASLQKKLATHKSTHAALKLARDALKKSPKDAKLQANVRALRTK